MRTILVLFVVCAAAMASAQPGKKPCPARVSTAKPTPTKHPAGHHAVPVRRVTTAKAQATAVKKATVAAPSKPTPGKPAPVRHAQTTKPPAPTAPKPSTVAAKPTAVAAKPTAVAAKPAPVPAKPIAAAAKTSTVATKPAPVPAKPAAVPAKPVAATAAKPAAAVAVAAKPAPVPASEGIKPLADDPDRERILHLQEALSKTVFAGILGRLRVGIRVEELMTGKVLFDHRSHALMDPASNQKVLATAAALLRLGSNYRYRTEALGPVPDGDGRVAGDVVLRGSGDPSLRLSHLDALARQFVRRGVTSVSGNVLGDPRALQSDEPSSGRSPLRAGGATIEVRVHPGETPGAKGVVSVWPRHDAFLVENRTETKAKGRGKIGVSLSTAGGKIHVLVSGSLRHRGRDVVVRKAPPSDTLYTAIVFRQALIQAGIDVRGEAGILRETGSPRVTQEGRDGTLLALAGDDSLPLFHRGARATTERELLALHESAPLSLLIRRVNKASDNDWAERVLEITGAESYRSPASTGLGLKVVREIMDALQVPLGEFHPANGSGLGHANRVTPYFMVRLLSTLYFDPRVGPELYQSLSVGGVDGTTRNRFLGTSSAQRVRAKTGTLNGVSCLSGVVGDGSDLIVFSILVEGHRRRSTSAVRSAQVMAVNAMMRYARNNAAEATTDEAGTGTDYETGDAETTFGEDEPKAADPKALE